MELSTSAIVNGFWKTKEFHYLNIESTTFPEDYRPGEKLKLLITQLTYAITKRDFNAGDQKKLVESWCKKLKTLPEVKYLWLPSRVSQEIFDSICEMENLEGLWIKWSAIKSVSNIRKLKKLAHLYLGASAQVVDIGAIGEMKNLVTLEIEQLSKISNFACLGNLDQLRGLGIEGSMWKTQTIDDLKFLASLGKLKYLSLINTQLKDSSFDPIIKLKELERFDCSTNYPAKEFEKLKSLENLKYGNAIRK